MNIFCTWNALHALLEYVIGMNIFTSAVMNNERYISSKGYKIDLQRNIQHTLIEIYFMLLIFYHIMTYVSLCQSTQQASSIMI